MDKATLNKAMKEYKALAAQVKDLETKKGKIKDALMDEFAVKGVTVLNGADYTAILSTYNRESIALNECLREFGREVLEAKRLINSFPVNSISVKENK